MLTIDDGTLSAWAKAEAARRFPCLEGPDLYLNEGVEIGVMALAERLRDPGVIEAGVHGAQYENRPQNDIFNQDQRDAMEQESRGAYRALISAALTAMLAKIAEVDTHEE